MIIDGKKMPKQIQDEIKSALTQMIGRKPCLAVILVGEHPASRLYIARKTQACMRSAAHSVQFENRASRFDLRKRVTEQLTNLIKIL